jgi:precorrin-2 dehydrogenase
MTDYPIQLQLKGRLCIVVGGGTVGRRKVSGLLAAGARVRLITAEPPPPLPAGVELVQRPYRTGDLAGSLLAFAATDDPRVNAAVAEEARAAGILVNIADDPQMGDFTLPAILRRGSLTLTAATGGSSPALAVLLRDRLAGQYGPEWEAILQIAAALRCQRLTLPPKNEYNAEILHRLLEGCLPELFAAGDAAGVNRLLAEVAGAGMSLEALGIRLPKGKP